MDTVQQDSPSDRFISDAHLETLAASGISPEDAQTRGYETIRDPRRLKAEGIAEDGCRTQGILIPLLRVDGSRWGCQYRPDSPRERNGKLVKYETPHGQRNGIDVPPGVGDNLDDPNVPLWITEGSKKADCAATQGLCCVALIGVWNWIGKNSKGGKTLIDDFREIAFNGRQVVIAFDGDVSRKPAVQKAMTELAQVLSNKDAKVAYLHLPDADQKVGLDDYLMAGHTVEDLWKLVQPTPPGITLTLVPKTTGSDQLPPSDVKGDNADVVIEDGAALLDDVLATHLDYVVFGNEHQAVAVTLWEAATHAVEAFQHATRLVITSPQKRCGKSRLLDVIGGICARPLLTSNATSAAIFRSIGNGKKPPTLVIDEADGIFGTKKLAEQNEDLRQLLNAGFGRGRPSLRCVGPNQIPTPFETFAMAALAGIGKMPDTVTDRAVNIDLQRRSSDQPVNRFRMRRDGPRLTELHDRLEVGATANIPALTEAEPSLPVDDREADAWEPLIAIADAAGGHWPETARAACKALCQSASEADDELGTRLLTDIQQVFAVTSETFMPSQMLVSELRKIDDSPWDELDGAHNPLTVRKLAALLKDFGVTPGHNDAKTVRGYHVRQFRSAFRRYIRPDRPERPKHGSGQQEWPENDE